MRSSERWRYALKPASWPKVFVPALFGQAVGMASAGRVSLGALGWGVVWTALDIAFIVLLNDWGDQGVDALKRRMFPRGCSPKTIPDGILPARALLKAGVGAGVAALGWAALGGAALARPLLVPLTVLSLGLFVLYTLPPARLNYRGGGELVEMLGVGGVLPALHVYAQCGEWAPPLLRTWAPGLLALCLTSALASGLSDEESDRAGGKHTFTTWLGNPWVRRAAEGALVFGSVLWLVPARGPSWAVLPVVFFGVRAWRVSPSAVTNAFAAQGAYKLELHRAIWWGTLALGLGVLVDAWRGAW